MVGCFCGVVTLTAANEKNSNVKDGSPDYLIDDVSPLWGMLMSLVCAIGTAVVIVTTRKLKDVHFSLMLFWYGFIATSLYFIWDLIYLV